MLKMKFLLLLTAFVSMSYAEEKFIFGIAEHPKDNFRDTRTRCMSTLITARHLLATARCVQIDSDMLLAITISVSSSGPYEFSAGTSTMSAERGFIHPDYQGEDRIANVGIVLANGDLNRGFHPRTIGGLKNDGSCELFGWGGAESYPRRDAITVRDSNFCDPNFPGIFCSTFSSKTHRSCSANVGSPIICQDGSINGILISDQTCTIQGDRFLLNYISVEDYKEWIETTSGIEGVAKTSIFLILSAAVIIGKMM